MIVTTLDPPAAEPVNLAEAKEFLRIASAGEDNLVAQMISGARARIEEAVGLALISRTLRVVLHEWPAVMRVRRSITLPVRPADELVAVRVMQGGVETDVADRFRLMPGRAARLTWVSGALAHPDAFTQIEVDYVAGFGEAAEDVADSLRLAVRQMVGHAYRARYTEGGAEPFPPDVAAMVAPWRRVRL